jgi:kynurenine formamidase
MTRQFIDLSIYLENEVLSDPPPLAPKITYQKHQDTLHEFMAMIPGTTAEDYPDGEAAAAEWVTMTTHSGTHLDAPYHFHSTMDAKNGEKKASITIDEVPLEWCFQPGVKLDFRHFPDGYVATAADVEAELQRIGHVLQPLDIVVVNTRAGSRYGHNDFVSGRLRHGLRGDHVPAGARRAPDRHRRLELGRAVLVHREEDRRDRRQVADLGRPQGRPRHRLLPPREAAQPGGAARPRLLHLCFPHKVRRGSAGWTRAVAIVDDALLALPRSGAGR